MVLGGEVGRDDLSEVAPLGEEDDDESREHGTVIGHGAQGAFLFCFRPFPPGICGTEHEHASYDGVNRSVREDGEEGYANSGGDGDVHHEGAGRAQPYLERAAFGGHDQTGEHRLVR